MTLSKVSWGVALIVVTGCDNADVCDVGELQYAGRPPQSLFAYDTSCRDDGFSMPATMEGCEQSIDLVEIPDAPGILWDERTLLLIDSEHPGDGRALVFTFGFVDEAGGEAPIGWTLLGAGSRAYLTDELAGSARFVMTTYVAEYAAACGGGACAEGQVCATFDTTAYCARTCTLGADDACGPGRTCAIDDLGTAACQIDSATVLAHDHYLALAASGDVLQSDPGRLEIYDAIDDDANGVLAGAFYLAWETPTGQPQGEVAGCFDLTLGPPETLESGETWRLLSP